MMTRARIGSISSGLDAAKPIDDLEDAESDRVGADREQVRHAAEHERGERAEQHADREGAEHRQTEDPGPQEDGGEGEQRSDGPDQRLQALDRHAEQRRAIGAVGAGADRDADAAQPQEQRERR